jgi:branched-chain amino acid transport system substrate-binding protein/urea transport system substrate-binding protein
MTESIKVAALLPLTGPLQLYGQQAKLGLDLAIKEIHQAGGILGRPLELLYSDSLIMPEEAAREAARLVNSDGLLAIIGPFTSSSLHSVLPICQDHKVPLLYASNYEGGQSGRYFFSFSTVPDQEISPLLPYMQQNFGDTYYMVGADRAWPHQMFAAAEPIIAKLGGRVVGKEYTLGNELDFAPLIQRVKASQAKILVFALKGDGLQFIPQAYDQGLFKTLKVAYLGLSETDLGVFQGKGEGMYTVVPFLESSARPAARQFVAKVRANARPDATVSHLVLTHYMTLIALKAALEKAGRCDPEALVDALEGLEVSSPTGPVTIGAKDHHATLSLFLARTEGAELLLVRELGTFPPSTP